MATINEKYFSGAQVSIYIGDVWVDDVNAINYSIQHNTTPIYGYGSQHYDLLAKGQILVTGSFRINFREPNYIWMALTAAQRYNQTEMAKKARQDLRENLASKAFFDTETSTLQDKRDNLSIFLNGSSKDIETLKQKFSTPKELVTKVNESMNHTPFNITIGYGYGTDGESVGEVIEDITIVGDGKVIEITGQPIQEEYQFIARRKR